MKTIPCYLDNIIFSLQKAGGISTYWYELNKRFLKASAGSQDVSVEFIEQSAQSLSENIVRKELSIPIQKTEIGIGIGNYFPLRLLRYLPLQCHLKEGAIFHSSYYRLSKNRQKIAQIVTVHDFTYEYFVRGWRKWLHHAQKGWAIRHADGIICVSENTKRDLLYFFPQINPKIIKVIYLGASEVFYPLPNKDNNLKKDVLFVGDRSSYKNFHLVVESLVNFPYLRLVMVGGGNLNNNEKLQLQQKIPARYLHLSGLSGVELNERYNAAYCLIYPSRYEGFGIPVLEAMQAGCPVITTAVSSLPEVAGNAALMVNDINSRALACEIERLSSPELRQKIIHAGLIQARQFSWDRCFAETVQFYREVHSRKFS